MKKIALVALFLAGVLPGFAQDAPKLYTLPSPFERYTHYLATARFMGAAPLGSFSSNYIDKASFQNYSISIEWVLRNAFSVGGEIGSTYFEKRIPRALYQSGDETISAVQTRTLSQYPVEVFGNYHLLPKTSTIQPYIQVSGGISILDYTVFYGSLSSQNQKVAPKYGIGAGSKFLFKKDGSFGIDVRVKYDGSTYKYDYIENGISSVSGSVGVFYRWW
jgi:outer membrane protein W